MKPLVKITENIVEKRLSRLGAIQTHIFLNWNYIAEQFAKITILDKIKFSRNKNSDGQITIKVQNGFGPEIQHATPFLLNQINSRFGYKTLWGNFLIEYKNKKILFACDTGYGNIYKDLGKKYGPIDLTMINMILILDRF